MNTADRAKCVATLRTLKLAKGGDVIQWADIDAAVDAAIDALAVDVDESVRVAVLDERNRIHTALYEESYETARHGRALIDRDVVGRIIRMEAQRAADGGGVGV